MRPSQSPVFYAKVLESHGLYASSRGVWSYVGPPVLRAYGWKLHLTASTGTAQDLLNVVAPILRERHVTFKVARSDGDLATLNSGHYGPTQVGKFMTVYPSDDEDADVIGGLLVSQTENFVGPRISTDVHLGGAVFARFGAMRPRYVRDRLGVVHNESVQVNGQPFDDSYAIPARSPTGVAIPFNSKMSVSPKPVHACGWVGDRYLAISVLSPVARGATYLAIDLLATTDHSLVVLKEARHHCELDGRDRDRRYRLMRETEVLQRIEGSVRAPRYIATITEEESSFIVISHLDGASGSPLRGTCWPEASPEARANALRYWNELCAEVERLHAHGLVHRDLKEANVVYDPARGGLSLLDFDLTTLAAAEDYDVGAGTAGYMSPQQRDGDAPSYKDDIYAIGAVIRAGLSGLAPTHGAWSAEGERATLAMRLRSAFEVPAELADAVARSLSPIAAHRPSLAELRMALRDCATVATPSVPYGGVSTAFLRSASRGCVFGTLTDAYTGLWLAKKTDALLDGRPGGRREDYALHRSVNRGVAGTLYVVAKVYGAKLVDDDIRDIALRAATWLEDSGPSPDAQMPGLFFGEAGVAVALSELTSVGLLPRTVALESYVLDCLSGPLNWHDMTHGAAGQGLAALHCANLWNSAAMFNVANECAEYLVAEQDVRGCWIAPKGAKGVSGKQLTGFAHGTAGIVYFLQTHAAWQGSPKSRAAAANGAEWLLECKRVLGDGSVVWPVERGKDAWLNRWCSGAPGIALALLRVFEGTRDSRFADTAAEALAFAGGRYRGALFGQCCGLAGIGEILLEASRVLAAPSLREQASRVGAFLSALSLQGPQGIVWSDQLDNPPMADFGSGVAGISHFLARLHGAFESGPFYFPASRDLATKKASH